MIISKNINKKKQFQNFFDYLKLIGYNIICNSLEVWLWRTIGRYYVYEAQKKSGKRKKTLEKYDDKLDFLNKLFSGELTNVSKEAVISQVENPAEAAAFRWKVGRNDPCPCGSGKKFKKCCGKQQKG